MYDQFLSRQWVAEQCVSLEKGAFLPWFGLCFVVIFCIMLCLLIGATRLRSKWGKVVLFSLFVPILLPVVVAGTFLLTALFGQFLEPLGFIWYHIVQIPVFVLGAVFWFFVCGLFVYALYLLFRDKHIRTFLALHLTLLFAVVTISTVSIMVVGSFVACGFYGSYMPGIRAGHRLHAVMKTWHDNGRSWPKDIKELRMTEEKTFNTMMVNAKVYYEADPARDWYTLIIRPSRYSVIVFDSTNDFRMYVLGDKFPVTVGQYAWPPEYPGPWEQLPR